MMRHTERDAARIGFASLALVDAPAPARVPATRPPLPPPAPPMTGAGPFFPGALPVLPPIPGTGKTKRPEHSTGQLGLLNWARETGAIDFGPGDVDGVIGRETQQATQLFQAWSNRFRGTSLPLDGLFGPSTLRALEAFGD